MYKKTVTYEDFNGQTITEDLYFNLNKDNLIKLIQEDPDFADRMQAAFDANDGPTIFAGIRTLILKSYGIKSTDGKNFSKKVNGVPLEDTFEETAAYGKLMDDFIDNLDDGAAFFMGIFPQDLMAQAQVEMAKQAKDANQLELPGNDVPDPAPIIQAYPEIVADSVSVPKIAQATQELTDEQLQSMTPEEIIKYYQNKGV